MKHPMSKFMVLTKDFVANESVVIDLKSHGLGNALGSLIFQNKTGQSARFLWQSYDAEKKGYFKEIMNDLGVKVAHYDGFITVTNGGGVQHLEAELKM
ncbi:hypothetical protein EG347_15050 [Chryseobacterium sp. G0186]|uniref:hypothetical protein n=1 Tax=Chryseobacterium sp. G0186 TaxID=2487064 RepID=UPI000F4D66FE|nr:hypothetical protein [Chryseobacterium sp. G0186]AZA78729.1 hypothetical protein EG347_15050 [Chryseobacterium sp. G0186]